MHLGDRHQRTPQVEAAPPLGVVGHPLGVRLLLPIGAVEDRHHVPVLVGLCRRCRPRRRRIAARNRHAVVGRGRCRTRRLGGHGIGGRRDLAVGLDDHGAHLALRVAVGRCRRGVLHRCLGEGGRPGILHRDALIAGGGPDYGHVSRLGFEAVRPTLRSALRGLLVVADERQEGDGRNQHQRHDAAHERSRHRRAATRRAPHQDIDDERGDNAERNDCTAWNIRHARTPLRQASSLP